MNRSELLKSASRAWKAAGEVTSGFDVSDAMRELVVAVVENPANDAAQDNLLLALERLEHEVALAKDDVWREVQKLDTATDRIAHLEAENARLLKVVQEGMPATRCSICGAPEGDHRVYPLGHAFTPLKAVPAKKTIDLMGALKSSLAKSAAEQIAERDAEISALRSQLSAQSKEPTEQDIERMAEAVHNAYLETCTRLGWEVKESNKVPYAELSDDSKELDRASVRAVLRWLTGSPSKDAEPTWDDEGGRPIHEDLLAAAAPLSVPTKESEPRISKDSEKVISNLGLNASQARLLVKYLASLESGISRLRASLARAEQVIEAADVMWSNRSVGGHSQLYFLHDQRDAFEATLTEYRSLTPPPEKP